VEGEGVAGEEGVWSGGEKGGKERHGGGRGERGWIEKGRR